MTREKAKTFFSYSRKDSEFALKLANDLRSAGANIWIDQLDIPTGEHWDSVIQKALETCESFLIILSPNSVISENVLDEMSYALSRKKQIIPVLILNCDIPYRLQRIQYINFVNDYNHGISKVREILGIVKDDEIPYSPAPPEKPDSPTKEKKQLRSESKKLSSVEIDEMLRKHDFYERHRNPKGKGRNNNYKNINNETAVYDEAAGLIWQQAGSENTIVFNKAGDYVDALNKNRFAGFNDWRLPTLEEAMSLMEAEGYDRSILIHSIFDSCQSRIWTSDKFKSDLVWTVSYENGGIYNYGLNTSGYGYVRAVRSGHSTNENAVHQQTVRQIHITKLRSTAAEISKADFRTMSKKNDFFDSWVHPEGKGIDHCYKIIEDGFAIYDEATGLMWQQSGSEKNMNFENAKIYIAGLNKNNFAGFSDWRLPTLEEAWSLVEPEKNDRSQHINPLFDREHFWIWSGDTVKNEDDPGAWAVNFDHGRCDMFRISNNIFVRAVLSVQLAI